MRSSDFTYIARRAAIVAGAVALVSAAACSDDTTAPQAPTAAISTTGTQEALYRVPQATVTVQVKTAAFYPIYEKPRVKFRAAGFDTVIVKDNDPADKNSALGVITVSLPKAVSYGGCLFEGTTTYGVDFTKSHCMTVWTSAATVDLGTLLMHEYPYLGLEMMDAGTGAFLPGAQAKLIAPDGTAQIVSDGGIGDIKGLNDGMIDFRAKGPGKYTYCETVAPAGYWFTNPICKTIDLYWDMGIGTAVLHNKKNVVTGPS